MEKTSSKCVNLKEAIDHYGSLQNAVENLEVKKKTLEEEINKRKVKNQKLTQEKVKLNSQINGLNGKYFREKKRLEAVTASVGKWERQYNLFQSFLAMLLTSPSVSTSLKNLIDLLQELENSEWALTKTPDEMRSLFVRTVMGDYLKCFHCMVCGSKFMVNSEPHYKNISNYYQCPACHTSYGIQPDDSFIKAMVSGEQLENTILVEDTLKENKVLGPLKAFLNVTCDICHKPITTWTKDNVWAAINKCGWGHDECWNTDLGKVKLVLNVGKLFQEKQ